jgi:hypothetical protein
MLPNPGEQEVMVEIDPDRTHTFLTGMWGNNLFSPFKFI